MTLNTTYNPTVADGNGVTTQFSYSFNPISINYLKVSLEISGAWVQQFSGWTATVSESGGIVTFDTAPTTRVAIERDVPEEQPTSYETSSGFQAKVVEHSFDMLTGMVQELKEKSERSVSVEIGSPINPEQVVQQIERVYTSIDNVDAVADDLTNVDAVAVDLTNVNKVAGSITNVNKVGNSITKVNTVAGSIAKVGTVADNISDVNAVGGDIVKVKAVADDLTNVDKVADNETNINKVASIDSDVSSVASIKNDVSTVSGISGNVTSVANNSTNITTVATNISNVNKVGNAISNVNKVGNNISDVNDVADDLTNIDIVAGDIADVSAVGGNILNVTAVANDLTNIDAVAGNQTNIDTVALNNANVSRVGSNINNVNSVANNETNINTVVSNLTDVTNVASYIGNIVTVSSGMDEVQAVAGDLSNIDGVSQYLGQIENVSDNITNVNAVGSNISNVNTVAGDHANIQTVVDNITAINNAPTYANNSKIWAEGLDGEVAPLGGTHSSKGWAQIAEKAAVASWGNITGTLSNQTDLQNALNAKANDSDVVKTTGVQTVAGVKTFTNGLERSAELGAGGSIVTELIDTNGKGSVQNSSLYAGDTIYNRLQANNTTSGKYCYLDVRSTDTGNGVVAIQGTATKNNVVYVTNSTSTDYVATMGWVNNPDKSTNVVHRTGDETIGGGKNFTSILNAKSIELNKDGGFTTNGGFIDFHYAGSSADYTSRIIEDASGQLRIAASTLIVPAVASSDNSNRAATTAFVKGQGYATNTDVVHKAGTETITGPKNFSNDGSSSDNSQLDITCTNIDHSSTPTSTIYGGITFFDVNGDRIGKVEPTFQTNGTVKTNLSVSKIINDTIKYASLSVCMKSDGTTYTEAPASAEKNSIVTTTGISKSDNGYVKLGNGIIVQWGYAQNIAAGGTITLPTPFTSAGYGVVASMRYNGATGVTACGVYGETTTKFQISKAASGNAYYRWIAVGY